MRRRPHIPIERQSVSKEFSRLDPPKPDEYAAFYQTYLRGLEGKDADELLRNQPDRLEALCDGVDEPRALFRYAPGKWSIKQVIGHITDSERIFEYRLLRFARSDVTPLSGFDERHYVENGDFDERPLTDLLDEFRTVRMATRALLKGLSPAALNRRGEANGASVTVRALAYLIPAHAEHHLRMLSTHYELDAEE